MATYIKQADFINSVADSLQFISYYHPQDFVQAMAIAYNKEQSKPAKDAIAQILVNSHMCAIGKRPICQDTGIVCVFIKIGMDAKFLDASMTIDEMVNEGVALAYLDPTNKLRASIVDDPIFLRKNTKNNAPAVVHYELVLGDTIEVEIAAKGGGSENKSKFAMLNPSDSVVDWVLKTVPTMGSGWCPPGILGIGVGGTAEKAMLLAKKSLMNPIDMQELLHRGAQNKLEELRIELYTKVNALGIGAQGLGGLTTVLDVKISDYPTHAASKPIAMIPNCAASRHIHFVLFGSGFAIFTPPSFDDYPNITFDASGGAKKVNINNITKEQIKEWKSGETILLSGKILTGRDAAHKRMVDMLNRGEKLPVNLANRFIYYVGPVDPVGNEVVGPAGPTTATRMDKFTRQILEQTGLIGMIGKAERGDVAISAIKDNQAVYLIAVGGAAYLVSKSIKSAKVLAFEDLGMEAIYEFLVEDMPVTVAVDTLGNSIHKTAPVIWAKKIAQASLLGK
ncbi:MAG: fumarate hydratase [Bacteroidia bacterium]|nr:MAG: fumarate hydratase [Bacteroidia bacterium]